MSYRPISVLLKVIVAGVVPLGQHLFPGYFELAQVGEGQLVVLPDPRYHGYLGNQGEEMGILPFYPGEVGEERMEARRQPGPQKGIGISNPRHHRQIPVFVDTGDMVGGSLFVEDRGGNPIVPGNQRRQVTVVFPESRLFLYSAAR